MSKRKILNKLSRKNFVSGQKIADSLNISRTAVYKHIKSLKKLGFEIESVPKKGYRLKTATQKLHPLVVDECLKTRFIGRPLVHFEQVNSTINQVALKADTAKEGLTVVAEKQTKGRGRFQREWSSPKGGIWCSILLKPRKPPSEAARINVIASLSIAEAIEQVVKDIPASIKWPNDVILKDAKVAGVLTEMVAEIDKINYSILSFGINVNNPIPAEFKHGKYRAISIKDIARSSVDRVDLFCSILKRLEQYYLEWQEKDFDRILDKWKKRCITLGKDIEVSGLDKTIKGRALDIDEIGRLIIKDSKGNKVTLSAGEVTTSGH